MTGARPEPVAGTAACACCGVPMECRPDGDCWCLAIPPRLPVPAGPAACLCPRCLDAAAAADRPG